MSLRAAGAGGEGAWTLSRVGDCGAAGAIRLLVPTRPGQNGVTAAFQAVLKRRPDFLSMAQAGLDGFDIAAALQMPAKVFPPGSGRVEAIEIHHLVPRRHEVLHELLLRVGAPVDLREGAQLRVRAEDQVDPRAGPPVRAGRAVA